MVEVSSPQEFPPACLFSRQGARPLANHPERRAEDTIPRPFGAIRLASGPGAPARFTLQVKQQMEHRRIPVDVGARGHAVFHLPVPPVGADPTRFSLKGCRSAVELRRQE